MPVMKEYIREDEALIMHADEHALLIAPICILCFYCAFSRAEASFEGV